MSEKKKIGILGGLGPESTGDLYLRLIQRFQERFKPSSNTDYPHIVINSIPAQELIANPDQGILRQYHEGLKELERSDVDIILIACNTAYCFLESFQNDIKVPILDLPEKVRAVIHNNAVQSIILLGTQTAYQYGLYSFNDVKIVIPTQAEIKDLSRAIHNLNIAYESETQRRFIELLYQKYVKDSDCVILGCSEVASVLRERDKVIDPFDIMIDSALDFITLPSKNFLIKGQSRIHGNGIFTTSSICKGEIFYQIPLNIIYREPHPRMARIGEGKYVSDDRVLNWVNHSCDPNTELDLSCSPAVFRAIRDIDEDEEITVDYGKTEVGGIKVICSCGSHQCRGMFLIES